MELIYSTKRHDTIPAHIVVQVARGIGCTPQRLLEHCKVPHNTYSESGDVLILRGTNGSLYAHIFLHYASERYGHSPEACRYARK